MQMILKTELPLFAKANGPLIKNGTMNTTPEGIGRRKNFGAQSIKQEKKLFLASLMRSSTSMIQVKCLWHIAAVGRPASGALFLEQENG